MTTSLPLAEEREALSKILDTLMSDETSLEIKCKYLPRIITVAANVTRIQFGLKSNLEAAENQWNVSEGIRKFWENFEANSSEDQRADTEADRAQAWLLHFMDGKPVAAAKGTDAAKIEGFSEPTVRRARKTLGITSRKNADGWEWHPPVSEVT